MGIADTVVGAITAKKLVGEQATILGSASMTMASGQVFLQSKMKPVCAPSGSGFRLPEGGNIFQSAGNFTVVESLGQQVSI